MPTALRIVKSVTKRERLEARITREQKRLFLRAANLRGTSLTDFVVASTQRVAQETIKDSEVLSLRGEAREAFVKAFLNPPQPTKAARRAAMRYKAFLGR